MRTGPRPLAAHIGLMASALESNAPDDYARAMQNMLLGLKAYQLHPYKRDMKSLHTRWHAGSVTVGSPEGKSRAGRPLLLLVPSMVNKAYIMDLMEERSLLRWLAGQGIDACLMDWGDPVQDESLGSIESAITQRLVPAIEALAAEHGSPIHVLGYCMGGTILAGAAQFAAKDIKSLTFLAAPWDFHAGTQALLKRVQFWAPNAAPMMVEKGHLPMEWMQTVFASLNPAAGAHKFGDFAAMDQESDAAKLFVAVEDWLNDGVDLPTGLASQPIFEWFIENRPARGQWYVGESQVNPKTLKCPSLILSSRRDRLVDFDTAASLRAWIPGSKLVDTQCGHIGMMAGKNAVEKVWQPLAEWIKQHN
jgi:polyhydroxyalkanoate synthase